MSHRKPWAESWLRIPSSRPTTQLKGSQQDPGQSAVLSPHGAPRCQPESVSASRCNPRQLQTWRRKCGQARTK